MHGEASKMRASESSRLSVPVQGLVESTNRRRLALKYRNIDLEQETGILQSTFVGY